MLCSAPHFLSPGIEQTKKLAPDGGQKNIEKKYNIFVESIARGHSLAIEMLFLFPSFSLIIIREKDELRSTLTFPAQVINLIAVPKQTGR